MEVILLGIGASALYFQQKRDANLYERYVKIQSERGVESKIPVDFMRPPKQYWESPSTLVSQPGMPEGIGSEVRREGQFNDQGVFGIPKTNFLRNNALFPLYRTDCLYL